jgi:hypothetical protein
MFLIFLLYILARGRPPPRCKIEGKKKKEKRGALAQPIFPFLRWAYAKLCICTCTAAPFDLHFFFFVCCLLLCLCPGMMLHHIAMRVFLGFFFLGLGMVLGIYIYIYIKN